MGCHSAGEESPTSVLDMATGEEMEPDKVVPAFIYKLSWPRDLLVGSQRILSCKYARQFPITSLCRSI